jgi:hypothetical protein
LCEAAAGRPANGLAPGSVELHSRLGEPTSHGYVICPRPSALVAPLVKYIWTLHQQRPDVTLTVAVPEIMARHWWHRILHDRIAWRLRRTLDALPGVVVTSVPFHLAYG